MRTGRGDVILMLAGTVLIWLSGYLFLALIGHGRFDAATTAALSATYLLGNVLGPGVFVAVEQETSRAISDAITRRLDDQVGLILAPAVAMVGSAVVYLIRDLAAGQRRFRRYAMTVLIDGATRIAGCLFLIAVGGTDPVAYGLALRAGPATAALCTAGRALPRDAPSDEGVVASSGSVDARASEPGFAILGRDVGLLLTASALAMVLANLAPVVVTGMLTDDPVTAAGFAGAVVLTRVPLLFMGPIQALLLPGMTAAAATADHPALRSTITRGLGVIAALGLVAILGTALFGRPVIAVLFGADRDTTHSWSLVLLTASAAIFMAVQLLQPALVALRLHRSLVVAWIVGGVVFGVCLLVPLPPVDRGVLAQIAGPTATLLVQLIGLARMRLPDPDGYRVVS